MHLTKHHGLGNDFLIALLDAPLSDAPAKAQAWCHRTRGIGADGLIVARPSTDPAAVRMDLYNADGSRAEISGNGLRCLGQAIARDRDLEEWSGSVETDAGSRSVVVAPGPQRHESHVRVEMGDPVPGPTMGCDVARELGAPVVGSHLATVDLGNPHLILHVVDAEQIDMGALGAAAQQLFPGGANVHAVSPMSDGSLVMVPFERGVGLTQACGSGAVAASYAAHEWGVVGLEVPVHMPGGVAVVDLGVPTTLSGPAVWIADIEVDPS